MRVRLVVHANIKGGASTGSNLNQHVSNSLTNVNLDARNGRCAPLRPKARMHSFSARRLLFISAPSILICREAELPVSFPRSLPAKSIKENLPEQEDNRRMMPD